MDLDPPGSPEEKQAMYRRLMEILEEMFKPKVARASSAPVHKEYLHREMRKLIGR